DSAKHADRAAASAALCVIAAEGLRLPGKTVLRNPHPKLAFAKAAALLLDRAPIATGIHPTAVVAPLARVEESASIGPYAAFGEGKHWKFPQVGIVEIGDDVEIGANTTIDRGSLDDTRIAEGVKLDNLIQIGHNCQIGAHTVMAAQVGFSGSCTVGQNVVIGGQAGFGERCELEDGAMIGGQSGVLGGKTIRGGQTVWGTPARSLEKFKEQYASYARLP